MNQNKPRKNGALSLWAMLRQCLCLLLALTVAMPATAQTAKEPELPGLHQAAKDGDRAKIKHLLAAGADVEMRDHNGDTPLIWAADGGHQDIAADLLGAGADASAAGANGETPLHWAAYWDYPAVIDLLIKGGADANRKNDRGQTALHDAGFYGHPAAIRALVKNGANINQGDTENADTALHLAAQEDNYFAAYTLIRQGANVNQASKSGDTPLHEAAWAGGIDIVNILINAGADNVENKAGRTPLYYSQQRGHDEVTDALLSAGKHREVTPKPEGRGIAERVFDNAWESIVAVKSDFGSGSGVIVAPDIVATNCHVIGDRQGVSKRIVVQKAEGRQISERPEYRAKYEDGHIGQDFCLLRVDGLGGAAVKVRLFSSLRVGEDVYAIGNPEGLDLSLSAGVISQLRTEIPELDLDDEFPRIIQTDTATSRGSSGGGLFDKDGNLIGITTAGHPDEDAQNLNFAIPADLLLGYK